MQLPQGSDGSAVAMTPFSWFSVALLLWTVAGVVAGFGAINGTLALLGWAVWSTSMIVVLQSTEPLHWFWRE